MSNRQIYQAEDPDSAADLCSVYSWVSVWVSEWSVSENEIDLAFELFNQGTYFILGTRVLLRNNENLA